MSQLLMKAIGFIALLLGLAAAVAGCGSSAHATTASGEFRQLSGAKAATDCPAKARSSYDPRSGALPGQPILAGPVIVGCRSLAGEPVRFIAYVRAEARRSGEQLCWVLEQPRQKAVTGGSCFQVAPTVAQCRNGCPLIVEATVGQTNPGKGVKGSLITGAVPGVMEEAVLSGEPDRKQLATPSQIVVVKGAVQKQLHITSVVSLFASIIEPCLRANQTVFAQGQASGEEFNMQGSDPFGCRA